MLSQFIVRSYIFIVGMLPKPKKRHWLLVLSAVLIIFCASYALAQELNSNSLTASYDLKPKSEALAWVLAFDPLPADALFYAGKYGQGTANSILGLIGMGTFWTGVGLAIFDEGEDELNKLTSILMGAEAAIYFPILIWDGVVGVRAVKKHNATVAKRKASLWRRLQPTFAVSGDGYAAGARFNF